MVVMYVQVVIWSGFKLDNLMLWNWGETWWLAAEPHTKAGVPDHLLLCL